MNILHCTVVLSLVFPCVFGHGYLIKPAQRSSAWRAGFKTPVNNDDNGLNCGGLYRQWNTNGGKCGACGDPYDSERKNEAGGKYATGTITESYIRGQIMEVEVELTAHHEGWFEFRLCAHNNENNPVSQECLDQTVLDVVESQLKRYDITGRRKGRFVIKLQLPAEVTCEQCVFQWKYNAGNNWGCDANNQCGIGRGPQEQFINCADIEIKEPGTARSRQRYRQTSSTSSSTTTTSTSTSTTPSSTLSTSTYESTCHATGIWETVPGMDQWCVDNCNRGYCPQSHCGCTVTGQTSSTTDSNICHATGIWRTVPGMDQWCVVNCYDGYCPSSHCVCTGSTTTDSSICHATGIWRTVIGMDQWCFINCNEGYCPSSHCVCS